MARYFSDQRIAELNAGRDEVRKQFAELRERLALRAYKTERGAEFTKHGLCRRLEILARTIDQVYDLLPPSQDEIPSREKSHRCDYRNPRLRHERLWLSGEHRVGPIA
jgi:hypothetical protein